MAIVVNDPIVVILWAAPAPADDRPPLAATFVPALALGLLGKPLDGLGPEVKTQILGRWYIVSLEDDVKEIARHPSGYAFCDFRAEGVADCKGWGGSACRYEVGGDHIVVRCDGEEFWVVRVGGKFYSPSHGGFMQLIRLPAGAKEK